MSDKRKFLIENFETIQKARARKPRPLSYEKIAKILSENGIGVSSQLVKAVCKKHEETKMKGGLAALDGAATKLDKKVTKNHGATTKAAGAAVQKKGGTRKVPSEKTLPK